jgi:hypothetical protein
MSSRTVSLATDLYPEAVVWRTLEELGDRIVAQQIHELAGAAPTGDDLTLRLVPRPGENRTVIDDALDAILRASLKFHLGRNARDEQLPRGL